MLASRLFSRWIAMGCFFLFAMVATVQLHAGEHNETLSIGDDAPAWTDLPGVDGQKHSLAELSDYPVVVVAFTCNSCPTAQDYEDRLIAFAEQYREKVTVVAINVNKIEEDSLPNMQKRAKEKGFPYAYLFDETQQIAKAYGAVYTPEFFVLGPDRKIVYMGAMDDKTSAADVTQDYLGPAVQAALQSKTPEVQETLARGCRVRYVRTRK